MVNNVYDTTIAVLTGQELPEGGTAEEAVKSLHRAYQADEEARSEVERAIRGARLIQSNRADTISSLESRVSAAQDDRAKAYRQVSAIRKLQQWQMRYVERAVVNGVPDTLDDEQKQGWLFALAKICFLIGHESEVETLYRELEWNAGYTGAREIIERVRENVGEDRLNVSVLEAMSETVTHLVHHPSHSAMRSFWSDVWTTAKTDAGLCGVVEQVAGELGVPDDLQPTRSGYLYVRYSATASIPVSDVAIGDDWDSHYDLDDVMSHTDRYEISIDEVEFEDE